MVFLAFEGLDGSGKTSLIQKIKDELVQSGIVCTVSREPGGTPLGEELRRVLLRTTGETPIPECELLLYEAIRSQHVAKVLKPALSKKQWVLCDRFTASTVAFQAAGRSLRLEDILWLNKYATLGLEPHLNILLDISPDLSLDRQKERIQKTGTEADRFENEKREFHEAVRQSYLQQSRENPEKWLVLDAQKSIEELFDQVIKHFKEKKWL